MNGTFTAPENDGDTVTLTGKLPVSEAMVYGKALLSFTKGWGRISTRPAGYAPCHNPAEVIEKMNYDRDADVEQYP